MQLYEALRIMGDWIDLVDHPDKLKAYADARKKADTANSDNTEKEAVDSEAGKARGGRIGFRSRSEIRRCAKLRAAKLNAFCVRSERPGAKTGRFFCARGVCSRSVARVLPLRGSAAVGGYFTSIIAALA